MLTITYGDTATAQRAGATLRRVHQAVQATDPATGQTYNAEEPDLLVWVQNTLTYGSLSVFERYAGDTLTAAARERYIQEQKIAGELLGIDPATLPSSSSELASYLDDVMPQLGAIPESLWLRDMTTSRRPEGDRTPRRPEAVVSRLVMDEALSMMLPVHRELFGVHIPPWRRVAGRVATPLMLKAAGSKLPTGATIAKLREQVDVEAFGGPRRVGATASGH